MEHKPVTGWIGQAYSKLEMIYAKRRNKLLVDNIRNEFFLNVLSFQQCSTTEQTKEMKVAAEGKTCPLIANVQLQYVCPAHY